MQTNQIKFGFKTIIQIVRYNLITMDFLIKESTIAQLLKYLTLLSPMSWNSFMLQKMLRPYSLLGFNAWSINFGSLISLVVVWRLNREIYYYKMFSKLPSYEYTIVIIVHIAEGFNNIEIISIYLNFLVYAWKYLLYNLLQAKNTCQFCTCGQCQTCPFLCTMRLQYAPILSDAYTLWSWPQNSLMHVVLYTATQNTNETCFQI